MKVLHYSDRHCPDFLDLYDKCDVLVATGDLTYFDFSPLENIQNRKPAFGVYGNHDSGRYFESVGIQNLHLKTVNFNQQVWGGFQGCLKYKEGDLLYTEEQAESFASTFPRVDILLLHAGPKGMLDDPSDAVHTGSEAIRRYVISKRPNLVFLGHQYSDAHIIESGIELYRTYGARIIEI